MILDPLKFHQVTIEDTFWKPRQAVNRAVTIPIQYEHCKTTGRIDGIDPDHKPGDPGAHHIFWDSDVAKWIETASYSLQTEPDPQLEALLDEVIAKFAKLQRPDGYVNSWYTNVEPEKRWSNLRDCHELYCAGHLMEAAVAHFYATGKQSLLQIMCRYADYIDTVFGPEEGKRRGYPGHEEIELALVKLYDCTGNERYAKLARFFIDERGQQPHYFDLEARERGEDPSAFPFGGHDYNQSHVPVRQQTRVVGHAVRAMYLYCGMADIAKKTGDAELIQACEALWQNVCQKQMYVTGGIGPSRSNEGFTFDYDMPEETAYCETCAAIGLVFWNHRLLQLTGERRFADVMERALYNGALSGVSLSGDRFFYVNPLASLGDHHRQPWFGCACCPGNISRLIASVGEYAYSSAESNIWVHLYVQGSARFDKDTLGATLRQVTNYPWDGAIRLTLEMEKSQRFSVHLRIPSWCRQYTVAVNGLPLNDDGSVSQGYLVLERQWQHGDLIELSLDMPVERVSAHPQIRMANGKVALQRGPLVYCLEEVDNPVTPLSRIRLPRRSELRANHEPDLLGGVTTITGEAELITEDGWESALYSVNPQNTDRIQIKAVPYSVWDNRAAGHMLVWLRE